MFGSHLSIAGGLTSALDEARALKLGCVQIFTKNQQQWRVRPLETAQIAAFRDGVHALGWSPQHVVSHASYLINLASPDDALWQKSIDLMEEEIRRCDQLGIAFLVHHPGSFTTSTLEQGLDRITRAYVELMRRTEKLSVVSCLENTVGGGGTIGRTFDELGGLCDRIVQATGRADRVGTCIDTCHAHAGGYDLSTPGGAQAMLDELDRHVGMARVRVLHVNDSKAKAGSRLDRHEHIGKGTIGIEGFRPVVNHPVLGLRPKILETPKGSSPGGTNHDTANLRRLYRLLPSRPINQPIEAGSRTVSSPRTRGRKSHAKTPAAGVTRG